MAPTRPVLTTLNCQLGCVLNTDRGGGDRAARHMFTSLTRFGGRSELLLRDVRDIECKYGFLECKCRAMLHGLTTDCTAASARTVKRQLNVAE